MVQFHSKRLNILYYPIQRWSLGGLAQRTWWDNHKEEADKGKSQGSSASLQSMFSWLIPPFKSLVPLVFTNTCFFSPHTFLLHYSDFGRDTTRRWGSWEGWLLPWLWCDWSTKGPWDFLIPSWIQWWKFTIFNPKAIKVKEIQPFRGAAPFQYQYEWQWFLMPHFTLATPRLVIEPHQVCWHP